MSSCSFITGYLGLCCLGESSHPSTSEPSSSGIELELRQKDIREDETITEFVEEGCGCPLNCSSTFSRNYYELTRGQCAELSHETLDIVIIGQLMALTPAIPSSDINITH